MLDSVRYWLALASLMTLPWAIAFWYVVHPLIGFWRRVGPIVTYAVNGVLWVGFAAGAWVFRGELLAREYGTHPALWAAAGVAYAIAVWIEVRCRRYLSSYMLVGMPELRPRTDGELLNEGIYARVRHPRYLAVTFALLAIALFCNYLATWWLLVGWVAALPGLAHFEERELLERFGPAYAEYCRKVPRFVPHR